MVLAQEATNNFVMGLAALEKKTELEVIKEDVPNAEEEPDQPVNNVVVEKPLIG
jgi:hypothetical protein